MMKLARLLVCVWTLGACAVEEPAAKSDGSGGAGAAAGAGGQGEGGAGAGGAGGAPPSGCLRWPDADGDGFGDAAAEPIDDCDTVAGHVDQGGDCDDANPEVSPAATELVADGVDQNCDGEELCHADADGDGYGAAETVASAVLTCTGPGLSTPGSELGDCDDSDQAIHPGATDVPGDAVDQDCDASYVCFVDGDGDGYRTEDTVVAPDAGCSAAGLAAASAPSGDCADGDADVHPGAFEATADGLDQDCDGLEKCYVDADDDGYRPSSAATTLSADMTCTGAGVATAAEPTGDCYDLNASARPNQTGYFSGDRGDGSFDYDCNGAPEKQWTAIASCLDVGPGNCLLQQAGWWNIVPACGDTDGLWVTVCIPSMFTCGGGGEYRTQRCR
jgi:hypothetical protein